MDYDFHEDNLVLLIKRGNKQRLQLRSLYYDTAVYEAAFHKKISSIYRDCMGNLHLECEDSVFQVYPLPEQFYFYTGTSQRLFREKIKPCIASGDGYYIFSALAVHNQYRVYYSVHRDSVGIRPLHALYNELKAAYAQDIEDVFMERRNTNAFNSDMTEYVDNPLKVERRLMGKKWYYERVLTREIFGPLFKIDTSVYIFDLE